MVNNALPDGLALQIYQAIPEGSGRYEQDVYNDFLRSYARYTIKDALNWLCMRGHLKKCGTPLRPLYVRHYHRGVRYTNIHPVSGEKMLLAMHRNFTQEKPNE